MIARPKLYLGMPSGENYGWGVCGKYLSKELTEHFEVHSLDMEMRELQDLDAPLFQAMEGQSLVPWFSTRAPRNIGYVFFEDELNPACCQNAEALDLLLAGSTWCCEKLKEAGISRTDVLLQGIDPELFYPITQAPPDDRFVIFSGGKFELRKGQDLVLAAFKALQDKYKDLYLITAWANSWPQSLQTMTLSPYIQFELQDEPWPMQLHYTCVKNGIDSSRVQACPLVPSGKMRGIFSRTHLGLFPNRCEGGTNLVLMEYMACAKPAIVSATSGHLDVASKQNSILLDDLKPVVQEYSGRTIWKWEEPSLDSIIATIEYAYEHRESLSEMSLRAAADMEKMTWKQMASCVKKYIQKME